MGHEVIRNAYLANEGKGVEFEALKSQVKTVGDSAPVERFVGYSIDNKCFKAAPSKEIIEAHGLSWIRHVCGPTSLFIGASLPIYLCYRGSIGCPKTVQALVAWQTIQAILSLLGD